MNYQLLASGIQTIRQFFDQHHFLEIFAPPVVPHPGFDPHIHPFQLYSSLKKKKLPYYLHTSPEFYMKEVLSKGEKKIFTLGNAFRDEEKSPQHRPQFLMLEWYRAESRYETIQQDIKNLFSYVQENWQKENSHSNNFQTYTTQELIQELANFNWKDFLDFNDFYHFIKINFPEVPLPEKKFLTWEDCFFLVFLNIVEPKLHHYPQLILTEYPAVLSALSTLKKDDPLVCERFEVYLAGIEIANCFNELVDFRMQKMRWREQAKLKKNLYRYQLPTPKVLFDALERGIPQSAGIALGVERFLHSFLDKNTPMFIND